MNIYIPRSTVYVRFCDPRLYFVKFRMLDANERRSRIRRSAAQLDDTRRMYSGLCGEQHVRGCRLGPENHWRKVLLAAYVNRCRTYSGNRIRYPFSAQPRFSKSVLLLLRRHRIGGVARSERSRVQGIKKGPLCSYRQRWVPACTARLAHHIATPLHRILSS